MGFGLTFTCTKTFFSLTHLLYTMSRGNVKNTRNLRERERPTSQNLLLSKHLTKIYPFGLQKNGSSSISSLSFSSISLSLSQNSNDDSSLTDHSCSQVDHKVSLALRLVALPPRPGQGKGGAKVSKHVHHHQKQPFDDQSCSGDIRRCNWITKSSDEAYVSFHDECWGVPVYDDNKLFELLALSGMLMDHNWTDILKRRELFKEAFCGFDPEIITKMGEKEIEEIASDKAIKLADGRVRCITNNAKCILKIVKDYGSFSSYMWGNVNYKAVINRYKHPRNVPLRTPKAEAISKDLQRRGFRFVGPVIVYSFMQAAGLTIDHMVDCYRHGECVSLAERPWRHI